MKKTRLLEKKAEYTVASMDISEDELMSIILYLQKKHKGGVIRTGFASENFVRNEITIMCEVIKSKGYFDYVEKFKKRTGKLIRKGNKHR